NASAVHREGGDHVEQRKKEIHGRKAVDEGDLEIVHGCRRARLQICVKHKYQRSRDHDIDHWAGDRNEEFFPGLFRYALKLGDAADRQECNIGCWYTKGASGKDVAELVQKHAEKK